MEFWRRTSLALAGVLPHPFKNAPHDLRQESSTVHRLATSKWRESSIVGLAIDRDQAAR
jgi:hypothetical protein